MVQTPEPALVRAWVGRRNPDRVLGRPGNLVADRQAVVRLDRAVERADSCNPDKELGIQGSPVVDKVGNLAAPVDKDSNREVQLVRPPVLALPLLPPPLRFQFSVPDVQATQRSRHALESKV